MADINLLNNQLRDTTHAAANRTKWFVWIMLFLFLIVAGSGVALYLFNQKIQTQITDLEQTNQELQQEVLQSQEGVDDAQAYQAQLSNLDTLLTNHISLSPVLAELERYTYQRAQYLHFSVRQETGRIHVEGNVDGYQGLAILLLGLSTSENFENVRLLSVATAQDAGNSYRFSIDMDATANLFRIQP